VEALGEFLVALPPPLGMIVTALSLPVALGSGILTFMAYQRRRPGLAALLSLVALAGLVASVAYLTVT